MLPSRNVAVFGIVLFAMVVLGYLSLGMVLKFHGFPNSPDTTIRFNPLAATLRTYGAWSLLLPVFWVVYVTSCERRESGLLSLWLAGLFAVLIVFFAGLLFYATCNPFTRGPLGVGLGRP